MKSIRWAAVALALCVAFAGCRRKGTEVTQPTAPPPAEAADQPAEPEEPEEPEESGTGGSGSTGEPVTFNSDDPERGQDMETAYEALIRGDSQGPKHVLALKDDAFKVLKRAMESENVNAMVGASDALGQMPSDEASGLLAQALSHAAPRVRVAALDAIAHGKMKNARAEVVSRLDDEELEVRATACDALSDIGATDAELELLFTKIQDPHDVVRAACAAVFAATAKPDAWREELAKLLLADEMAPKDGALRVLAEWKDETSFDLIRGRLADPDAAVVVSALAAVAPFGDTETVREVRGFVTDARVAVRIEAVAALEKLPADEVRQLVYEALKDREAAVRIEAASQLPRWNADPETFIRLHALLRDESAAVRDSAALALGELKDPRSFKPILDRLGIEKDSVVATDLVAALAACDAERALPHLIDRMDKAQGPERTKIIRHLRSTTGQDLPIDAKKWREWYAAEQKKKEGATQDP